MKKLFLIIYCLLGFGLIINAQDEKGGIRLLIKNTPDSVVLRWAPSAHIRWSRLNRYGYRIERFQIESANKSRVAPELIGPDTLKPWPVERWKSSFPVTHPYAPVALQAVYGQSFNTSALKTETAQIRAKSQEGEMRYAFSLLSADLDARVADALALRWCDKTVKKDIQVLYRVISLDPMFPDTAIIGINRSVIDPPLPAPEIAKADEQEGRIQLSWDTYPANPIFTAYILERSEDGQNWIRLNNAPLVKADPPQALYPEPFFYYTDTAIAKNYKPYQYRLIGITPFAEISEPSKTIVAMGRDKSAPQPPELENIEARNQKLILKWKYPQTMTDLKGFMVARSNEQKSGYNWLTPKPLTVSARSFTDEKPDVYGENYYIVYAVDTAGNMSPSMPGYGFIPDSIPPSKPALPSGTIDTSGVVRLHWKLGKEPDIMGYRVYFANAPDHEFSILTPKPIKDTLFTDTITLNTLTKKIYYRIAAVDRNYNHSQVSEILALSRPDIIPPVAPLFADYHVSDTAVVLKMIPSSSADVKEHTLYRRESGTESWKPLQTWRRGKMPEAYTDRKFTGKTYYQYTMQAVDSSGNKSPYAPTVDVRMMPKVTNKAIENILLSYDKEKRTVNMSWKKPPAELKYYVIYRGKNGKRPASLTSVNADQTRFSEVLIGTGVSYTYLIKAIYADGGESPLMKAGTIESN